MASGHVNRTNRPNTWLHRPPAARVKKVLANPEPSTPGPSAKFLAPAKRRLVIGVLQTRFSHLEFFAFGPNADLRCLSHHFVKCRPSVVSRMPRVRSESVGNVF